MGNLFGGNNGGNAADLARSQEAWRQRRITSGLGQINSIYGGGSFGTNPIQGGKAFDPKQTYYLGNGTKLSDLTLADKSFHDWVVNNHVMTGVTNDRIPIDPHNEGVFGSLFGGGGFGFFGSKNVPGMTLEQARNLYGKRLAGQGLLFGSAQQTPGFNNDFYNQKQQAYIGYALPQVASQYNQMNQNTAFNLANRGLTQSSAGNMLRGSLEKERQLQTQGVGDAAIEQSNQLRKDVEGQRSSLVSQLYASGDPNTSMQGALNTAANFQTPNTYQPLGNLFSNWANMYLAKQYSGSPQTPGGGMGAFNPYGMTMSGAFGQQQMMPSIVGSSSSIVK